MKKLIKKILSGAMGFFARAAVEFDDIFNKGNPAENPAGKGTENDARPRKRLVDGIDADRFTRLCAVLVIGFVSIIGAVLICVNINSGGRKIAVDDNSSTVKSSNQITVTLGGNIAPSQDMIDSAATENGYNFSNHMSELSEVMAGDISIAGLCGQLDANGGNQNVGGFGKGNNYPSQLASAVSEAGVNYIFGANHYAFANGYDGMCTTLSGLHRNSLGVVGLTDTDTDKLNSGVLRINGINVGLAGYNCVSSKTYETLNDEQKIYIAQVEKEPDAVAQRAASDIAKMKASGADFVVVCINWGGSSDTSLSEFIKQAAKKIAEAGADVIVGYGPYVTMDCDILEIKSDSGTERECYVFYSLGSLFADMTGREDYTDAMSRSMTVTLTAARQKDGTVKVSSAVYNPIYMIKNTPQDDGQTYLKYMAVPAAKYVSAEKCPDIFTDEAQWKKCKSAFKSICSIADKTDGRLVLNELGTSVTDELTSDGKI